MSCAMHRLLAVLLFAVCAAQAQNDFPSRPLRIVVPSAPGGGTDIV
ncbi:MAG: tripartite tricarboxylate transporter substrate binding protein, partial [Betaproteobacteria bacterium]|nr:tripartite tricarboxylate transporter substrate binding protein [Betaproteobacteria bacterium]